MCPALRVVAVVIGFERNGYRAKLYLFLAVAIIIKPGIAMPVVGLVVPLVASARKTRAVNARHSNPIAVYRPVYHSCDEIRKTGGWIKTGRRDGIDNLSDDS